MNNILVIAPHGDDETLGCGGSLLKHKYKSDKIHLLMITNINQNNVWTKKQELTRKKEISQITKFYKFDSYNNLNYQPAGLDLVPMNELVSKIDKIINLIKPNIVYLNNPSDIHTDHQIVFKSSISCLKSFRKKYIKSILLYETLSETEYAIKNVFTPNYYADISKFIEKKIKIMNIYKSEVNKFPFPRSKEAIYSLARIRGMRIGVKYAEAFCKIFEKE
jgi:N-acetylglucosamine malate deacetylase 1